MTFIFTPERDPRREQMAEHQVGAKVKYRGNAMPAEILSGPHKTTGARLRYLIRKADGNVSLVPDTELEKLVPRLDQVAGTLAVRIYGRSFNSLDTQRRFLIARTAADLLEIADRTKGQI
jgi:hypothetical protein